MARTTTELVEALNDAYAETAVLRLATNALLEESEQSRQEHQLLLDEADAIIARQEAELRRAGLL